MESRPEDGAGEILYEGKHLFLKQKGSWEYVERRFRAGGVLVVAITPEDRLLLVEEYRPPVGGRVISLPAGLVGDDGKEEDASSAAVRELREETGFEAPALEYLGQGPSSPGLASETVSFYLARDARRAGPPTGDEEILLHEVPLSQVRGWAREQAASGAQIHPLLWAGLYLARL